MINIAFSLKFYITFFKKNTKTIYINAYQKYIICH